MGKNKKKFSFREKVEYHDKRKSGEVPTSDCQFAYSQGWLKYAGKNVAVNSSIYRDELRAERADMKADYRNHSAYLHGAFAGIKASVNNFSKKPELTKSGKPNL